MDSVNKLHLGIYGVAVHDGKILLVRKSRGPYIDKYDLPGGKIEHGEGLTEALAREILEETGLVVQSMELITNLSVEVSFEDGGEIVSMHHVGLIYRLKDFNANELNSSIHLEDVANAEWVELGSINFEQLSPFALEVVNNMIQ